MVPCTRWYYASFVGPPPRDRFAASQMKAAAAVLRRFSFTDRAQRAAALAPPLLSCIVTEEIWLSGEFSETACVLPVVRSDRCAEK